MEPQDTTRDTITPDELRAAAELPWTQRADTTSGVATADARWAVIDSDGASLSDRSIAALYLLTWMATGGRPPTGVSLSLAVNVCGRVLGRVIDSRPDTELPHVEQSFTTR